MCVAQRGALLSGGEGGRFTASPVSRGQSRVGSDRWEQALGYKERALQAGA